MTLYEAHSAHLLSVTAVNALVAGTPDRIYPLVIPQKVPRGSQITPCIVFTTIAVERQVMYCGTDGLIRTRCSLDSYASTYAEARELADAVRQGLLDFKGLLGGVLSVSAASLETDFDLQDPDPGLYRVSQSWSIWHVE
jgi:hypothetical protein